MLPLSGCALSRMACKAGTAFSSFLWLKIRKCRQYFCQTFTYNTKYSKSTGILDYLRDKNASNIYLSGCTKKTILAIIL
jgi:hypothetical protein